MPRPVSGEKLVTLCPAAAHRTDELPAKGSTVRPSCSLTAVPEFPRFLSCKFQGFYLLHYKSSLIPILWNLHFWYFKETLCFIISLHYFSLSHFFLTVWPGKQGNVVQKEFEGKYEIVGVKFHYVAKNQWKCSKCINSRKSLRCSLVKYPDRLIYMTINEFPTWKYACK